MSLPKKAKEFLINKFGRLGLAVIGGALLVVGFKIYFKPWYSNRRLLKAEGDANIIYEQRKRSFATAK